MKIVGIGYKKGSGKDALAGFMMTYIRSTSPGVNIKTVSFAGKLKDVCFQLYGWAGLKRGIFYESRRDLKEVILPMLGKSPRDIWIETGNKQREVYPRTWIDYALHGQKADILLVKDWRFWNEGLAMRDMEDSFLINIVRPGIPQGTDPAEVELDSWTDFDRVIQNDKDLPHLNVMAELLSRELLSQLR